ncbi:MAG: hypothetical protein U0519_03460 [Candidatus Gracilibacteria bacterium]
MAFSNGFQKSLIAGIMVSRPTHHHLPDTVSFQDLDQPVHVVCVRMAENNQVDGFVIKGHKTAKLLQHPVIRTSIYQDMFAAGQLHQNGVPLPNIQDKNVELSIGQRTQAQSKKSHQSTKNSRRSFLKNIHHFHASKTTGQKREKILNSPQQGVPKKPSRTERPSWLSISISLRRGRM